MELVHLSFSTSKAICPHCEIIIPFSEIEQKWAKSKRGYIRLKCKCNIMIGVTMDIKGDFRAYIL